MSHPGEGALNDYVDGRLDPREVDRVERHLEDCDACRERVAAITELSARLRRLPRGIAPRRDLREGIHRRLAQVDSPTRAGRESASPAGPGIGSAAGAVLETASAAPAGWDTASPAAAGLERTTGGAAGGRWLRAAVVAFVLAGAGTAVWLGLDRGSAPAGAADPVIGSYASAAAELARTVEDRKLELGPAGARALTESLASVDAAIDELERARRRGAADGELLRQLEARHRARLELLRGAVILLEES